MPLRDDWVSAAELIRRLDQVIPADRFSVHVRLVDDCSSQKCNTTLFQQTYASIESIASMPLRRNLGHQRAIAIGLASLQSSEQADAVLVMDADGEDTAEGALQLLSAFEENKASKAIFAERMRRSESLLFRIFYQLYRAVHFNLTGISVRVGNFCILPFAYLEPLVVSNDLWNHFSAAVMRSKLGFLMTPIARGHRISGSSKMNFTALVIHGLSAISVFGDIVGVRILMLSLSATFFITLCMVAVIATRFLTSQAIPGWATYTIGALAIILLQMVTISTSFTFFILSGRNSLGAIPSRDFSLFLREPLRIYPND